MCPSCLKSIAILLISTMGIVPSARAGEQCYLLMFASQRVPANPNYAHSFATFVRVTWEGDGPCPPNAAFEAHTISWLPCNLVIRTSALKAETGRDFRLEETLDFVLRTNQRVSLWGPYPIDSELYYRAVNRKAELDSGRILYKANDAGNRSDRVTNCIHAISSITEGSKVRIASPGWGESASYFILKEMKPFILAHEPESWVGSALGLDEYPIHYRDYRNPRSNAVVGPLFRLLGNERDLYPLYGPPGR